MVCSNVMATVTALWILLVMAPLCFSDKGPSASPSPPNCHIPCGDGGCRGNIICTWDPMPGPNNNLTYTLHWDGFQSIAKGHRAIIQRNQYMSHSELEVWVQTEDQNGIVSKSETATFNTMDIIKPPPPNIISNSHHPAQIHWTPLCDHLDFGIGQCQVRHRTNAEWILRNVSVSVSFTLSALEPCTNYSFQVRCACDTGMMSEWSEVHMKRTPERAPVGTLDVWRDCGILPQSTECVLTWKKLPISKAGGFILGYTLRLRFNNGSIVAVNESVASPVCLVCTKRQCYFNFSLKNVKSVSIGAYSAQGFTPLSHLDIEVPAIIPEEGISLEMNESNMHVSWNVISGIPNIKEHVVQYKEAGSFLGHGLDWIRLSASSIKGTIKGHFKKFTAYQVSVFNVLANNKIELCYTNIAHFVQGIPAKVPVLEVLSYESTNATLQWKPVLMSVQNGVVPYYQVGYGEDYVQNLSAYPQLKNRTVQLHNLKEDQSYTVWIKAVNQAGPGPVKFVQFKTRSNENIRFVTILMGALGGISGIIILLVTLFSCRDKKACPAVISSLYVKVPDPQNSKIIKEMTHQINDSLPWRSVSQQRIKISEIEIVKTSSCSTIDQTHTIINGDDSDDSHENLLKKSHCGRGKQEYSKMVDSDEEKNEEVASHNSWSSEEDNTGYEQHFMPTAIDMQAVAEQESSE